MILFAVLVLVSYVDAVVLFWGRLWWVQLGVAVLIGAVAVAIAFWVQWARPGRRAYASPEARLAIVRKRRGWYIADHIARHGTRGAGHRLRLRIRDQLTAAADAQRVVVFAHTTSMKLARAYMADIPGLRIASVDGDRILLVRPPAPSPPATPATAR